jgi:hypothetical protein
MVVVVASGLLFGSVAWYQKLPVDLQGAILVQVGFPLAYIGLFVGVAWVLRLLAGPGA